MNKIENGMKLDFSNVLIRPKRSTISSRSEVDLERNFNFYSKNKDDNVNITALNNQIMNLPKTKLASRFQNLYYELLKNEHLICDEIISWKQ